MWVQRRPRSLPSERRTWTFSSSAGWPGTVRSTLEYKIYKGDFFTPEYKKTLSDSTIVFVNNFAFGPEVDHMLKEKFADLKDGARIVSSKSFCPLNFRITERNLTGMYIVQLLDSRGSRGAKRLGCRIPSVLVRQGVAAKHLAFYGKNTPYH